MFSKKVIGACIGTLAVAGGVIAAGAPAASANPNWTLYDATHSRAVAVGDVLSGYGTLNFTTVLNGTPVKIQCQVAAGTNIFTHTVTATDQLSAAPGATLSVSAAPPAVLSSSTVGGTNYNVCEDITGTTFGNGAPISVTTTQANLTVAFTTPNPGVAGVYTGSLSGTLTVPAGEITFYDPSVGCGGTGPNASTALTGSYNASTGVLTPTANQALAATASAGCTMSSTKLASGSITLSPKLSLQY